MTLWRGLLRRLAPLIQGPAGLRPVTLGGPGRWDKTLGLATLTLTGVGLLMIYSATAATAARPTAYLEGQGIKVLVGFMAFMFGYRIDYHLWWRWAPVLFLAGFVALLLVFVPHVGHVAGGARRWIQVGSQTFQPTDFARLGFVVYLAFLLSKPRETLERFTTGLVPCLLVLGLIVFPVLKQPNLSTALALTMIAALMLVAGGIPWRHLLAVSAPVALALPWLGRGYQSGRIDNWLGYLFRGENLLGGNYQLNQSIIAIGSGGLFGQGPGASRQKWLFLPDVRTDFIFSILGEEWGFVGAVFVIALLVLILWRAYVAARRAPDRFGSLLAAGIGCSVAVYATVNIFVATGLFPTTGLPLPLVSYGGSAVLTTLFSLGILMNIATQRGVPWVDVGDLE